MRRAAVQSPFCIYNNATMITKCKIFFILLFLPMAVVAQMRFGYLNYDEVLQQMPQYSQVQADYEELQQRCSAELERNEQELTRKYVAFLDGQQEFPEPILRKRQKELQELVDKSVMFREELKTFLVQARDSLFAPLYATLDDAVARVCVHNNLAYIIDLERAGYAFVNPANGFDVTDAVLGTIELMGEPQLVSDCNDSESVATEESVETTVDDATGGMAPPEDTLVDGSEN